MSDTTDPFCYNEIIIQDCYKIIKYAKNFYPRLIVDIGANIGIFSRLCTLLFPETTILAYEPNPSALKCLIHNSKNTKIQVLPYAVSEKDGFINFVANGASIRSMISEEGNLCVETISTAKVVLGKKIDILKMDCEGSEWQILKDTALLRRTSFLLMEYHLWSGMATSDLYPLIEKGNHVILNIEQISHDCNVGLLWSVQKNEYMPWMKTFKTNL